MDAGHSGREPGSVARGLVAAALTLSKLGAAGHAGLTEAERELYFWNFFWSADSAERWLAEHAQVRGEAVTMHEATPAAQAIFGDVFTGV